MEASEILARVNSEEAAPYDWLVFPLIKRTVIVSILGWTLGVCIGSMFLIFVVPIMIPHNYQAGVASALFSTLILSGFLFIGLGSLWELIKDIRRLSNPVQHVIVITPQDFVKQEGRNIDHVPLEHVKYITARGTPAVDRSIDTARADTQVSSVGENISSVFTGRRLAESRRRGFRKRMRAPTSLAFIDSRTDKEIVVVTDKTYGDPFYIAAHLKQYAEARNKNFV